MSFFSMMFLCFSFLSLQLAHGEKKNAKLSRDREALVSFKAGIVSDPQRALGDWDSSSTVHVCDWSGVKCDSERTRVAELDLSGKSLAGTISSSLANLSSLTVLDLSRNFFRGQIPAELGRLSELGQLSLSTNLLGGNIPPELGSLGELVYLDLGSNSLGGPIPGPLFCGRSSKSLQYVDFSNNSLTGEIPLRDECELRELRFLLLWSNRLAGPVPLSLAKSTKLEWLDLESNALGGELPSSIVREMPQLQFLYLSYNEFVSPNGNTDLGPFFASLNNSSKLQELELAGNRLGGPVPSGVGDLSGTNLVQLHLDGNRLRGPIPPQISKLVNLTLMNLSSNSLNGTIPPELFRMRRLERVYLAGNELSGEIPAELGEASHLGLLDLSGNRLSGEIPDRFSGLSQLRRLFLHDNELSGRIPASLGKCVNLEILDLAGNRLSGEIPGGVVAGLGTLKLYLNLSRNGLDGPLPPELSKMDMVLAVDLSSNNLSGEIPPQLSGCVALESLNLSGNSLAGPLPESLGRLPYLRQLDVSRNRLTGTVPRSFTDSPTLERLEFSSNDGLGRRGNSGARGGGILLLPAILLPLVFVPVLCFSCYALAARSKVRTGQLAIFDLEDGGGGGGGDELKYYPRISYQELSEATGGFDGSRLIGSGRFGRVYKGVLRDGTWVAVKVLDVREVGIVAGSFERECRILKRTRHRNLIRIITTCSRPDFKALVLPLMSNGSLERHLYPVVAGGGGGSGGGSGGIDLVQVVGICNDVAEAVAYLHHHSPVRVVHCDLKPSNILLDDDMTALVADFGISRLLNVGDEEEVPGSTATSFTSTDGLLCGSVGYIAPEYGMGRRASTQGDVYSFGVLLLEIVTGKRPTDGFSAEGSCLHEWVKKQYPDRLQPIVEQALEKYSPANSMPKHCARIWSNAVLEMIELGLMCTQYNPSTRPSMQDVAHETGRLKEYLSNPSSFLIEETEQKD